MSSIKKAFGSIAGGRVFASLAQTVALLLTARWSNLGDFGKLSALIGIGLFLTAVLDFGMTTYILRQRAVNPSSPDLSSALTVSYLSLIASLLSITTLGWLIGLPLLTSAFIGVGLGLDKFSDTWQAYLLADGRYGRATYLLVQRRSLALLLIFVCSAFGIEATLSYAVAVASANIVNQFFRRDAVGTQLLSHLGGLREAFMKARHYWVAVLSAQARELDSSIVLLSIGPTAAGIYSAGTRVVRPALLVTGSLANVLLPRISRGSREDASRALRMTGIAGILLVPVGALLTPALPWIISFLVGESYLAAVPVAAVFSITIGPIAVSSVFGSILQGVSKGRFVAWNGAISAIGSLAAAFLGGYYFGVLGAALGLSGVLILKFLCLWIYGHRVLGR